jgi:hypothetical protein
MIIIDDKHQMIGWVLRASFLRDGIRYYAKDYGKKAFRIPIYRK